MAKKIQAINPTATPEQIADILKPQADTAKGGVELDIEALITKGTVERVVEPFEGFKVTMHSLAQKEKKAAMKQLEVTLGETSSLALIEEMKVPTLLHAITKMAKKEYTTPEQKVRLSAFLDDAPGVFVDFLYMEYQKLVNDSLELMQEGLKKSSQ